MFSILDKRNWFFGDARVPAGRKRRHVRLIPSVEGLETRKLLTINGQSSVVGGNVIIDNAITGGIDHTITQTINNIGPISDSSSGTATATGAFTGEHGSYAVSLNSTVSSSGTGGDAGTVAISGSVDTTPAAGRLTANFHSSDMFSGVASRDGTLLLNFTTSSQSLPTSNVSSSIRVILDSNVDNTYINDALITYQVNAGESYQITVQTSSGYPFTIFGDPVGAHSTASSNLSWRIDTGPLPDIAMGMASLSADGQSVNATYTISGSDLPSPGTVDFYWASGPNLSDKIVTLTTPIKVPTKQPVGSYMATTSIASLGPEPPTAKYIIAVADSSSADLAHNVVSVAVPNILLDTASIINHDLNISVPNPRLDINYTYHVIGNPGIFAVGVYQSAFPIFDSSAIFVASQLTTPAANSSGAGKFVLDSTAFKPDPAHPFVLVVVNLLNYLPAYLVSLAQLQAIMPGLPSKDATSYIAPLNEAMEEFQINTPNREAAFLAQVKAESGQLTQWEEMPSVAPAGTDLGTVLADGYKVVTIVYKNNAICSYTAIKTISGGSTIKETKYFSGPNFVCYANPALHGRGPIQITGIANYSAVATALGGLDIVDNPQWVSDTSNPSIGFRAAAAFWKIRGLNNAADLIDPTSLNSITIANNTFTFKIRGSGGLLDITNLNLRKSYLVGSLNILTGIIAS